MSKKRIINTLVAVIIVLIGAIYGSVTHYFNKSDSEPKMSYSTPKNAQLTATSDKQIYKKLSKETFKSGDDSFEIINNGDPDLSLDSWKKEQINYSDLDPLNRTQVATAYLSQKNLGHSKGRQAQTWKPTGWHNQPITINGTRVYPQNRGHMIAYTISFNFDQDGNYKKGEKGSIDNPKNLITQSEFSNQVTMQIFEDKIRQDLENGNHSIYRVTPVFNGSELMSRGLWLQYASTDSSHNFNVYVRNIEPKMTFDYQTGRAKKDSSIIYNQIG